MRRLLISEQEDLQLVKSYDFETLEEYFQYILESKINGQHRQSQTLYQSLSVSESMQVLSGRQKFWEWVKTIHSPDECLTLKKYFNEQSRED